MEPTIARMRRLEQHVEGGRDAFEKRGDTPDLRSYIGEVIANALNDLLAATVLSHHAVDSSQQFVIHYTSVPRMIRMLDKMQMRMYNADQANDPSEGSFFDHHLDLPASLAWAQQESPSYAYVASFVIPDLTKSLEDDLIYWRTYGGGGRGCSLKLLAPASKLYKVQYGAGAVARTRSALVPVLDVLTPLFSLDEGVGKFLSEIVREALGVLRFLYKHSSYRYERECRFVVPSVGVEESKRSFDHSLGQGDGDVGRHYYEHEALTMPQLLGSGTSVTFGPAVSNGRALKRSVQILTSRMGVSGIQISDSELSYRGK